MRKQKNDSNSKIWAELKKRLPEQKHDSTAMKCLIVDGHSLAYTAYYAYSRLSYKGKSTAMLYGVPAMLATVLKLYQYQKVVFCWDGKKHPIRLQKHPDYKQHREKSRDPKERKKFLKQLGRVQKLLYYMGIPQLHNEAVEGDDMVYWATKKYSPLYKVTILSGDKDMYQLINFDVSVYNIRTKSIFSYQTFHIDHSVKIWQYVDYLCLVGDTSDDIPGYHGIGPARASNFLRTFDSIKAYLKNKKAEFSGLNDKKGLKKIYKRNKLLMNLQYFNERYHTAATVLTFIRDKQNPSFNMEAYAAYCMKFNLKTMITETFLKPFKSLQ